MKIKAIYPGSFDPITNGHIDIIKRSLKIFGRLVVAVVVNPNKEPSFTIEDRIEMIKKSVKGLKNVAVDSFDGLLVDYAKKIKANAVIRGLRAIADFEYEFQMALMNRKLYKEIDIVYMMPSEEYIYLSSSTVKEVASLGGNVKKFVPEIVSRKLKEKYGDH